MAYLNFIETAGGDVAAVELKPAGFTALEWSVVALAERDPLSSLRTPGRLAVALGRLFGDRVNPSLADSRLEALRRAAVQVWHHGYTAPASAIQPFLSAGFSEAQFGLLVDSVAAARHRRKRKARA